jgi:hypothetical protein
VLPLCRAIANFPLPPDTERIFERMVGLSLVKTDLSTPLHVRIQDPLNNEKGPFNTTNFTKRNCKVVLSWVSELAQELAGPDFASGHRRGTTENIRPVRNDKILPGFSTYYNLRNSGGRIGIKYVQPLRWQILIRRTRL